MNEEKMTLKESVRLTLRAWRFYWKNTPRFVLSTVLWALADAVSPYAVVWFSARLVAELSDARDPQALAVDVAWVLGVTALLTLVRSVLLHWKGVEREQLNWQLGHDCFMESRCPWIMPTRTASRSTTSTISSSRAKASAAAAIPTLWRCWTVYPRRYSVFWAVRCCRWGCSRPECPPAR